MSEIKTETLNANAPFLKNSAIRSVNFFTASPVHTCDRCGQGIKYVAVVLYKDGSQSEYGMDCINKILANAPSLAKMFKKNATILKSHQAALEILNRKPEDMPVGSEYFGAGFGFIGDGKGKDLHGRSGWFFHPLMNWSKNQDPNRRQYDNCSGEYRLSYVQKSLEEYQARCFKDIEEGKVWFQTEITRLEGFLARVLAKVVVTQTVA